MGGPRPTTRPPLYLRSSPTSSLTRTQSECLPRSCRNYPGWRPGPSRSVRGNAESKIRGKWRRHFFFQRRVPMPKIARNRRLRPPDIYVPILNRSPVASTTRANSHEASFSNGRRIASEIFLSFIREKEKGAFSPQPPPPSTRGPHALGCSGISKDLGSTRDGGQFLGHSQQDTAPIRSRRFGSSD